MESLDQQKQDRYQPRLRNILVLPQQRMSERLDLSCHYRHDLVESIRLRLSLVLSQVRLFVHRLFQFELFGRFLRY